MRSLFALPALSGFDLVRTGDDRWCLRLAVPGFGPGDLDLAVVAGLLTVSGRDGAFRRAFTLPRHVDVARAELRNGLLEIDLYRELPPELRPRRIPIVGPSPASAGRAVLPALRERQGLLESAQRWTRGLWRGGAAVARS